MSRHRIPQIILSSAGVLGIAALAIQACQVTNTDSQPNAPADARATDQSNIALEAWFSPEIDPNELNLALAHSQDRMDLVLEDYERWFDFVGWALGYARPEAPGPELARCYVDHSPGIQTQCAWTQRLVVKRTGASAGVVVYVEIVDGQQPDDCKQMLTCAAEAWREAPAPLPDGDEPYVAVSFGGTPCILGEGLAEDQLRQGLEQRKASAQRNLESLRACEGQACEHNRQMDEACLVHIEQLERALDEGS